MHCLLLLCAPLLVPAASAAPASMQAPVEADYYPNLEYTEPKGVVLEVGGIQPLSADSLEAAGAPVGSGSVLVCTRRGEIWKIDDAYDDSPVFSQWADGLQEPLGLLDWQGWIYCVTRGEVLRMRDSDGDGRADDFETVSEDWEISGNYHEYAFGPRLGGDAKLWMTTNKPFGGQPFGVADWRGWAFRIGADGSKEPVCSGLRSPAGIETSPWGDVFYTDNQGEWCGASKLSILVEGDFHGHPHGIDSSNLPQSLVKHPGEVPNGMLMPLVKEQIPHFRLPAVWFPYDKMGRSPSGMAWDLSDGAFGPFGGQLFVGDQYQASVLRVDLEQVNGTWQGACFPFRRGLVSGVTRVRFNERGELLVGGTDRGWGGLGRRGWGLERLQWSGEVPFEILRMRATPSGFRLEFTQEVDAGSVREAGCFKLSSYTYELHADYGSAEMDVAELILSVSSVAADGMSLEIEVEGLREGYVHELHADGVRNPAGQPLLHNRAYYTLLKRPQQ